MSQARRSQRTPHGATLCGWAAAVAVAACSSTPTVIPTKNLDRPTDMAFACLAVVSDADGQTVLSGQPMTACHARNAADPSTTTNGQRALGTFAFVPNAGRGELAVADIDRSRLLDLTPQSPGYGMLPIGGDPEVLAVSSDGCWLLAANRTSCDFTLIDPARLLAADFSYSQTTLTPSTGAGDVARRLSVRTGSGALVQTGVGEVAFLPSPLSAPVCQADAHARAVATFPACDLVAVLDVSFDSATATIASAYYVRPDRPGGTQPAGNEPVCPMSCGLGTAGADGGGSGTDGAGPAAGTGGSADGSASSPGTAHLQALAVVPDGSRIYVGGALDSAVTSLDLGAAGLTNPVRTELAEKPGGVSRLRLAIDPFLTTQVQHSDGTTSTVTGQFLRDRGTFLYAFTGDDSIRVLNLDGTVPVECDVNVPLPPPQKGTPYQVPSCFPVGTPGRRALANGPGLRIPVATYPDSPSPLPRDIAFADLEPIANGTNYHALSGQFGFVVASNGYVYVLNLAPRGEDGNTPPPTTSCVSHLPDADKALPLPPVATNSFRAGRDNGQCLPTPEAVSIAPQRTVVQTDQAFATTATFSAVDGPLLRSFSTDGQTTSWVDYPDTQTIISRQWDIVWEGALPGTSRSSGLVVPAEPQDQDTLKNAGTLDDAGANFCASTVQPGDILMFSGCTQNADCQPDDQFTCQTGVSGARGMCLPIDTTKSNHLIETCGRFLGSRMRYEVAQATDTKLTLRLKLDEVPKTTLNRCTQDSDCRVDADHGKQMGGSPDGGGTRRAFRCLEVLPNDRRCVEPCGRDADCRTGHMCENVPWVANDLISSAINVAPQSVKLCVEAPAITYAGCLPQPQTGYSVRAGQSYLVTGNSLPRIHTGSIAADGTCKYAPPANPTLVNRIPMSAPRCPDDFLAAAGAPNDARFVQNLPARAGFNPCLYQGAYPDGTPTTATTGAPANPIRAFVQNPQIRFVLTNLDTYAGDLLAIHFELQYGFAPQYVLIPGSFEVMLTLGTRIVTGPTHTPESPIRRDGEPITYPYLYVVDQGRTALTPGSRGQVLRINPRAGNNEVVTFDTTYSGSTPFQLQ
jgi:hypothetical protein